MKLFRNIPLIVKMLIMTLPALIALIVVTLVMQSTIISTEDRMSNILYDTLYDASSNLINADRDFYQAKEASMVLHNTRNEISEEDRHALISDFDENLQQVFDKTAVAFEAMKASDVLYSGTPHADSGLTVEQYEKAFADDMAEYKSLYNNSSDTGDYEAQMAQFEVCRDHINYVTEILESYAAVVLEDLRTEIDTQITVIITAVAVIAVLVAVIVAVILVYLKSAISFATKTAEEIASGNYHVKVPPERCSKDETGRLCDAVAHIQARLADYTDYATELSDALTRISDGDLRIQLKYNYEGDFKPIQVGLEGTVLALRHTMEAIKSSAEQVNAASEQVASAATDLAAGTSEQSHSIENLSETVQKVADHSGENSENAAKAKEQTTESEALLERGNRDMEDMLIAMGEITAASEEIGKIISVIDNIAFQTNILALNASVEAARAGEAGKGFAVVADEVRNLAGKSAEAAKDTTSLIERSVDAVEKGRKIADKTAEALRRVSEKSKDTQILVEMISDATAIQGEQLESINAVVNSISAVVQNNAATAEETSAAAEELEGQAEALNSEVQRFRI
ncbi:MAG: methyl-accepting chemotaxis protein [Ruminococcus sp.]|jgi:methyl-accepting chemotaxis protein|nr:methyl-accepting chemotaxis protein [Ruminococcus sp.]